MPNAEAYKALQAGRLEWEQFRTKAFRGANGKKLSNGRIDMRSADLRYMDLRGYDLSRVDFSAKPETPNNKTKIEISANGNIKTNGQEAEPLSETPGNANQQEPFVSADLSFAKLSGSYLCGSRFCGTRLAGVDLSEANITGAEFIDAILDQNTSLRRAKGNAETIFKSCSMDGADLRDADLSGATFEGSRLHNADLSGVRFFRARLNGTSWRGTRIDERTNFEQADFPEHDAGLDQSEHMVLPSGVNWTHVRWLGERGLNIFAAAGLFFCFVIISAVRAAHSGMAPGSVFNLLSPASMHSLMIGFACILAAGLLFRLRCPEEVRSFSVAHWVYLTGNPRPVYLARALKERETAIACIALVLVGFLILGFTAKAIILAAACPACF